MVARRETTRKIILRQREEREKEKILGDGTISDEPAASPAPLTLRALSIHAHTQGICV
jgi:hypothetical protein